MLAAVIQARMNSSRLPGKTLADLGGKPMLERLIERVRASRWIEEVILATTEDPRDDALVQCAQRLGLKWFRGSEEDVLDRVYQAARNFGVETIVRVTPDCPLLDPRILDQVIELYRSGRYDYVSNTLGTRFPDGMDVEVFSFRALGQAWVSAKALSEREHVTPFIRNSGAFRLGNLEAPEDLSRFKWSVDTPQDLTFARAVYENLAHNGGLFHLDQVLQLLREKPELAQPHRGSIVNEGYYRSLILDPPIPVRSRSLHQSVLLREKAKGLIPGGSQTFSKGPTQFVSEVTPGFLVRGKGCQVWDIDGNEYLDPAMGLGSVILGYGDPEVEEAVRQQLSNGSNFSLPHPLELELAQLLTEIIPSAEMVRFGKNGSDATSGAVRLARAMTGREIIACSGYHGWQDWSIGATPRSKGVPKAVRDLTFPFEYNQLETLERIFIEHKGQVAAVILEPIGVVEPRGDFLQRVQALAKEEGALLIFDEVLTGFRFSLGGAQEYFGVIPDLSCFGKAMANGLPLSAVVGPREVMEQFREVFFSFTFGGEAVSLAAALATIRKLRRVDGVGHLWNQGQRLKDGIHVLALNFGLDGTITCLGLPPRTVLDFRGADESESLVFKSLFQQECLKRGLLFTGAQNMCLSHGESEVDQILKVYRAAMEILAQAIQRGDAAKRLEGEPVQPVFRRA